MTKKQIEVKAIEKITDGEQRIRINDYYNGDTIDIRRKDIIKFNYPEFSKNAYIDFVLPFIKGENGEQIEIVYERYSKRDRIKRSGEILTNFVIDKDCDIYTIN